MRVTHKETEIFIMGSEAKIMDLLQSDIIPGYWDC